MQLFATMATSVPRLAFLFLLGMQLVTATQRLLATPGPETEADPTKRKSTCVLDENRRQPTDCSVVTLPTDFCGACGGVGVMQNDGRYDNCLAVTRPFDSKKCDNKWQRYVSLNPCDEPRANAVDLLYSHNPIERENGRQRLDYFIFSICEAACDCVPQENVDPDTKAFDVSRGNCQAHARSHLPDIFPNLKLIRGQGDARDPDAESLPIIRPSLILWKELHGAGFRQNVTTPIEPEVKYFMERFMHATGILEDNKLWQDCLYLEGFQQGRLSTTKPLPSDFLCHAESTNGCPDPRRQVVMHRNSVVGCIEKCVDLDFVDWFKRSRGLKCGRCADE